MGRCLLYCFLLLLAVISTGCSGKEGTKEQMVDLSKISVNPEIQIDNLNTAIKNSKQQANLYARRAMLLLRQHKFEKALADATEAARLSKNAPENLFLQAQVLRALNREGESIQLALQAERNGFENELLYTLLSDLYYDIGQYSKAKQYNNLAYKLAPSDVYVLYYRGQLAAISGDTTVAIQHYQKALKDAPEFFELTRDLAGLYVAGKDSAKAQIYLSKANKLASNDGLLLYHQGEHFYNNGKTDSAIWSFNKAVELADSLVTAHHQLGYILYAQGNYKRAVPHFKKAAGKYGRSVRFLTTLASSYERTGQDRNALEQYEKLVKLEPTYYFARQKVARIKSKVARSASDSLNTAVIPVEEELI